MPLSNEDVYKLMMQGGEAPTKLLLHFDDNITDSSTYLQTTSSTGLAYASSNSLSGKAVYFTTTTGSVSIASNDFSFGTEDFCIEGFFYCSTNTSAFCMFDLGPTSTTATNMRFQMVLNSTPIRVSAYYPASSGVSPVVTNLLIGGYTRSSLVHWAYYRVGDTYYVSTAGNVAVVGTTSYKLPSQPYTLNIGQIRSGNIGRLTASEPIDEVRVTVGVGSFPYGATNFTPPSSPFSVTGEE